MSKPLELTIHPPLSPIVQKAVDWNLERGWEPYMGFNVEMHVPGLLSLHKKRLTEAELAAEAYRQMVRAVAGVGIVALGDDEIIPADAALDAAELSEDTRKLGVIKRFATTPHYFEAP